jgi:hypothetical protein
MAVAVSEAAATAIAGAIEKQTAMMLAQNVTFNAFLTANFTPVGAFVPNTPIAVARVHAQSMNDIHLILVNMFDQQQKTVKALEVLQSGLAVLSSQVAAGVTTAQLATVDQIKANKFQQKTTNESLKRADLPETQVDNQSFLESTKTVVNDVATFKTQIGISSLIEGQITTAITWTSTTLGNMVSNSFIGDGARQALGAVKTFIGITEPKAEIAKRLSETSALLRKDLLVDPVPIISGGGTDVG